MHHIKDFTLQRLEIHALMMTSLIIQTLLTFLAPLRKRTRSPFLNFFLWLLYLSADSVALAAIGVISRSLQTQHAARRRGVDHALWAPFLLLHLGGPDTITSLALEDNELWHRHAVHLATKVAITIFVLSLYVSRGMAKVLMAPILLVFFVGCTKYFERICALYYASREGIRALYGEATARSLERKDSSSDYLEVDVQMDEVHMINQAYFLYKRIRPHLAKDVFALGNDLDTRSQSLFLERPVKIGLRILEIELNIIHDILHTKVFLLYRRRAVVRIACFLSMLAASILYFYSTEEISSNKRAGYHYNLKRFDKGVTYTLLVSAMLFDIISFVMFLFFSDWSGILVARMLKKQPSKPMKSVLLLLQSCLSRFIDPGAKRWRRSSSGYNLIHCSLKQQTVILTTVFRLIFIKRIRDSLFDWIYVKRQSIEDDYLRFIFQELQQRAKLAIRNKDIIDRVCYARGNMVLEDHHRYLNFSRWTLGVEYNRSLLIWHIATDMCYREESYTPRYNIRQFDHRAYSKHLSEYMTYILLRRRELVFQVVGNSNELLQATKKAISIFACELDNDTAPPTEEKVNELCHKALHQGLDDRTLATTSISHSVFNESYHLAKELFKLSENKWEIISKVWVEMLCYAAIRSLPRHNLAHLSQGGELITLVWLFMTQLGFVPFD